MSPVIMFVFLASVGLSMASHVPPPTPAPKNPPPQLIYVPRPPPQIIREQVPVTVKEKILVKKPPTCWKAEERRACRPGEVLTFGSCCPPSCSQLRRSNQACVKIPVKGCFCKPGTVYNEDFTACIAPEECKLCGKHECHKEMTPVCPLSCSNMHQPRDHSVRHHPGCVCEEGYVRTAQGTCCRPENCPRPLPVFPPHMILPHH